MNNYYYLLELIDIIVFYSWRCWFLKYLYKIANEIFEDHKFNGFLWNISSARTRKLFQIWLCNISLRRSKC
jgi:hypothetical protein